MPVKFQRALCALALLASATAPAAENGKLFATPSTAAATGGASDMGQVTLALLLVLAVVFAAAWMMRRFKLFNQRGGRQLEVIAQIALGAKERAVLIKVGSKQVLVGVAPGSVRTLHVLDAEDALDQNNGASAMTVGATTETPSFKSLLRQSLGLK